MKRRTSLSLLSFTLLALCGCGSKNETSGPAAGQPAVRGTIAATCMDTANPFFVVIQKSMEDEAKKHGYELIYQGAMNDAATQQKQVKEFIVNKVDAIAINPKDSKAIGTSIAEANAAGIPVFTFDVKCLAPGVEVISHIGTANAQGGELAGEAMIEALGEAGGKVAILDFRAVESCIERVTGFKKAIDAHNASSAAGKIEIVAELPCDGKKDKGFAAAEDALQSHPDLNGIFAINDPAGLGAVAALEKAGKLDQVKIIAFDGMPEGLKAIDEGKIYADPIQHPDKIGRQTVQAIIDHLSGKEVEPEINIPATLYKKG
jgi:ribose transport system substrate-binding protein